ncbi:MAG: prepilin peptidase [Verrucomicrobiae bacterium]|nr:prepilin peptidase [Verrucomicrobiae bacterium]
MSFGLRLYLDLAVFLLGAALGSFFNVCIYRLPREESILSPPSRCPKCQRPIRWYDNIPLVSYWVLRGRCRDCREPISARYLFIELFSASLVLAVWLKYEFQWLAVIYWVLVGGLIVASFIDFEHYIIPNEITWGGIVAGIVFSVLHPPLQGVDGWLQAMLRSVAGVLAGGGVLLCIVELGKLAFGRMKVLLPPGTTVRIASGKLMFQGEEILWEDIFNRGSDRVRFRAGTLRFLDRVFENVSVLASRTHLEVGGERYELGQIGDVEATTELLVLPREAMGMGDVKFISAIGAFLGWQGALFSIFVSALAGGVVGLMLVLARKKGWGSRIPYGPYIALGALVWLFFGRELIEWYFGLLLG